MCHLNNVYSVGTSSNLEPARHGVDIEEKPRYSSPCSLATPLVVHCQAVQYD